MKNSVRFLKLSAVLISFITITSSVFAQQKSEMNSVSASDEMSWIHQLYTIDPGLPPSGLNFYRAGVVVSTLGDINGDGFGDWAIGNSGAAEYVTGSRTGALHIYFGSDSRRIAETPADLVMRGESPEQIAVDVKKAGDVNSDGYDDFLLHCGMRDAPDDYFPWKLYLGGSTFDTEADLSFRKLEIHEGFAHFASQAGDINNDGYDDILLSVGTTVTGPDTAHVYLYYGGEQMDNIPDKIFTGEVFALGAGQFGYARGAGDMNKDGYGDIIVSTRWGAKLFFGAEDMDTDEDVLFPNPTGAIVGTGPGVYPAGDVNSDGYDDLLVTAKYTRAVIYLGGETIDLVPDVEIAILDEMTAVELSASSIGDQNLDGFDDIILGNNSWGWVKSSASRIYYGGSAMDSIADITFDSPQVGSTFGASVQGGDDFDGDGYNDILVGDTGYGSDYVQANDAGGVSLFYGGEDMSVEADAKFSGVADGRGFGSILAIVGDVNNDGLEDLVVGASSYWVPNIYTGQAYLFLGGNTSNIPDLTFKPDLNANTRFFGSEVLRAGDLNGDNYDDVIIIEESFVSIFFGGESMDTIADFVLPVTKNKFSFSAPGDVNNDGYADMLFSESEAGVGGTCWLFYGGDNIFQTVGVTITGNSEDELGSITRGIGDINNDGINDFAVGVPGDDSFASNAGKVMIYFGGAEISPVPDIEIHGYYAEQYFGGKLPNTRNYIPGNGDINNDGIHDLAISSPGFSLSASSREGRIYIYYGGSDFDNVADVILTGDSANNLLGKNIMLLPDMNEDGYDELLTNQGRFSNGGERIVIFLGGDPMDSSADISMPAGSHFSYDASRNEEQNTVYFIVGNGSNDAAGPQSGRVTFYSTKMIDNLKLEVTAAAQSVSNGIGQTAVVQSNQETGFAYILYGGEAHASVSDLEAAILANKAVKKAVDQAFSDVKLSTTGLLSGTYYAIVSNANGSVSALGSNPIVVSQFTSLESANEISTYNVYSYSRTIAIESNNPNPANAQVFDITGKTICLQDIHSGYQEISIETAGVYIVHLWQKNGLPQVYKLVIQ